MLVPFTLGVSILRASLTCNSQEWRERVADGLSPAGTHTIWITFVGYFRPRVRASPSPTQEHSFISFLRDAQTLEDLLMLNKLTGKRFINQNANWFTYTEQSTGLCNQILASAGMYILLPSKMSYWEIKIILDGFCGESRSKTKGIGWYWRISSSVSGRLIYSSALQVYTCQEVNSNIIKPDTFFLSHCWVSTARF